MTRHTIVAGLGFGDEGKGAIVDYLTSTHNRAAVDAEIIPTTVVKSNGGAQAAHNVISTDGRHHTFSQFGSGTLNGARTYLSRFMLVEPFALSEEAVHLRTLGIADPFGLMTIDRRALITTPYQRAANRARENARGSARHGSCGMGIGETMRYALAFPEDAVRVADTQNSRTMSRKLERVRDYYEAEFGQLPVLPIADLVADYGRFARALTLVDEDYLPELLAHEHVVFETAQGVLLDENWGFHPYATYSTTTFDNAETLLSEAGQEGSGKRVGVLRAYGTRHGAGPFPTEDAGLTMSLPDMHNGTGEFQGTFRIGHLDLLLIRYALEVAGGADAIALTHLDRAASEPRLAYTNAYELDGAPLVRLVPGLRGDLDYQRLLARQLFAARAILEPIGGTIETLVEETLGVPVEIKGYGPRASSSVATLALGD